MCGAPGAGLCAGPPRLRGVGPFATGRPKGMLEGVDLPPVSGAVGPWVGTTPVRARTNYASTRCDNTSFQGPGLVRPLTRTYVFPANKRAKTFGLTQSVAVAKTPARATTFVEEVRTRIRRCAEANLGTEVETLRHEAEKNSDVTVWSLGIELSDDRVQQYWMAILRDGRAVSQIGFTPGDGMAMSRPDFLALVERAHARLSDLRGAG